MRNKEGQGTEPTTMPPKPTISPRPKYGVVGLAAWLEEQERERKATTTLEIQKWLREVDEPRIGRLSLLDEFRVSLCRLEELAREVRELAVQLEERYQGESSSE